MWIPPCATPQTNERHSAPGHRIPRRKNHFVFSLYLMQFSYFCEKIDMCMGNQILDKTSWIQFCIHPPMNQFLAIGALACQPWFESYIHQANWLSVVGIYICRCISSLKCVNPWAKVQFQIRCLNLEHAHSWSGGDTDRPGRGRDIYCSIPNSQVHTDASEPAAGDWCLSISRQPSQTIDGIWRKIQSCYYYEQWKWHALFHSLFAHHFHLLKPEEININFHFILNRNWSSVVSDWSRSCLMCRVNGVTVTLQELRI